MAKQRRVMGLLLCLVLLLDGQKVFFSPPWKPKELFKPPFEPQEKQEPLVESKEVHLVGPSGTGKSTTCTALLGLPEATSEDEEKKLNFGFLVSSASQSCTSEVRSKGPVNVTVPDINGTKKIMTLKVSDTPGIPDTKGRGVTFLDQVMKHIKENPPHCVVLMFDGGGRRTLEEEYALKALKECFCNMLSETRLIVYVNKLPSAYSLKKEGKRTEEEQREAQLQKAAEIAKYAAEFVLGPAKAEGFSNYVGNVVDSDAGVEGLKGLIWKSPEEPMDTSQFRTWSGLQDYYSRMLNDAEDEMNKMKDLSEQTKRKIEENEVCIVSAEKELNGLKTFEGWLGNQLNCYLLRKRDDWKVEVQWLKNRISNLDEKNTQLHRDLRGLQSDLNGEIEREKLRCQAVLAEFKKLENQMSQKVQS